MNYYSSYLLLICFIHVFIWAISMVGALFIKKLAIINILIFIPLIFLVQSFNTFHPFVIHKMKYIFQNIHKFTHINESYISELEFIDINRISKELNKTYKETLKGFRIMKEHEHKLIIPKYIDKLKEFFDSSFRNPFEASGLIIISFYINILILYYK
jgi:hypothetical protein